MENKNLQLIDLTVEELIYFTSFAKTIRHYGMDGSIYHYGTYAEQKVCITKSNESKWEVYIPERGNIGNKLIFSSCCYACEELLRYSADSNDKCIELMYYYGKEVKEMKNKLKQIEGQQIIPEITNSLSQLKKTKK